MAVEVYEFGVTINPGGTAAAPVVTKTTIPMRRVDRIEIVAPAGMRGQVGFQIGGSGQQFIPRGNGQYIVTDNERIGWDITGAFTSGDWCVRAYNLGSYAHTLRVRYLVSLVGNVQGSVQPIPLEALAS